MPAQFKACETLSLTNVRLCLRLPLRLQDSAWRLSVSIAVPHFRSAPRIVRSQDVDRLLLVFLKLPSVNTVGTITNYIIIIINITVFINLSPSAI
jgi:hypothetical protein